MSKVAYFPLIISLACLTLVACGDDPPPVHPGKKTPEVSEPKNSVKLHLDVPSLAGWNLQELRLNAGDTVELRATLENSVGDGIINETLTFNSQKGNGFSEDQLPTDQDGQVSTILLANVLGQDVISVTSAQGLVAQLKIIINQANTAAVTNPNNLPELPGVISWKILGKVTIKYGQPEFDKDIIALNGKEIKLQGFMMPLENDEKQQHFLLSTNPPSCFYCLPAGAEGIVEVYTPQEIPFTYDPIIVKGSLEVVKGTEMGLYYRMKNAQRSAAN
jgi:hypothetical protein